MSTLDLMTAPQEFHAFTYNPNKKGLRKVMGDLEAEIMDILWGVGRASVRDVHRRINLERPLAYTTVMTVMSRLAQKGILLKEKEGTAYIYAPSSSRETFMKNAVNKILMGLLGDFSMPTISQFVESVETVQPDKISELERLLSERKKHKRAVAG